LADADPVSLASVELVEVLDELELLLMELLLIDELLEEEEAVLVPLVLEDVEDLLVELEEPALELPALELPALELPALVFELDFEVVGGVLAPAPVPVPPRPVPLWVPPAVVPVPDWPDPVVPVREPLPAVPVPAVPPIIPKRASTSQRTIVLEALSKEPFSTTYSVTSPWSTSTTCRFSLGRSLKKAAT
jgi:hypothetical protein